MAEQQEPPAYLTSEGLQRFREELRDLIERQRPALAVRLRAAIQQGDLSENADYTAAKETQAFVEGRILQLETMLRNAVIIGGEETSGPKDVVGLGCRVTVVEEGAEPETYRLVGPAEAAPKDGRISHESPLGQALMGRKVGDTVCVEAPGGSFTVQVLKIE